MTDVPWTPGPWVISGKGSIRGPNAPRQILGYIARVNWQNRDANARLIADAPAMAEALEGLLSAANPADADSISLQVWDNRLKAASVSARAILARIKGATP